MIASYGADSVRWFILSDSPPERDIQWSIQGVNAAYKFLQKIYNLNNSIIHRAEKQPIYNKKFEVEFNNHILKITNLIENFSLNVVVANIYSIYHLFSRAIEEKISNECLRKSFSDLLKILIPFVPHLACECLEKLGEKNIYTWPSTDNKLILNEKINLAVQINGKTKDVIEIKKDLEEKEVVIESKKSKKINNSLNERKIIKIIFVKNKIINYLIKIK
tara:strand:- start:234 stop:890 length:657 start_codon:yes stop_codon:yes gene_type:complete